MSNKTINTILGILTALSIAWAISERIKRNNIENGLEEKNEDYLNLLSQYLHETKEKSGTTKTIKSQLEKLQKEYSGIDEAVANKLKIVIELISENKEEIAIEKLTLIIENILKDKYIEDGNAPDKKSCPSLFKLLEKARDAKWINKHQFNFTLFLKDKRNEQAHEISTNINENEKFIAFFSGIEIIYQLKGIRRVAL